MPLSMPPLPPTPRSCQAAASLNKLAAATKLAAAYAAAATANDTVLPSCRLTHQAGRSRQQAGCRLCAAAALLPLVDFVSFVVVVAFIIPISIANVIAAFS